VSSNSYAPFIDFPFEKLVPNGGQICETGMGFEAAMLLKPFKLCGQRMESRISFHGLGLPYGGPEAWTGRSYPFPPGIQAGFMELLGQRTPVHLSRLDFGPWREPFIEAEFHFHFVFRGDGPWLRDVSLAFSTVLEYQPQMLELAA
jgi:hypothetical protein